MAEDGDAFETEAPALLSRRIEKSAEAFRTISEVAEDLQVPQHVLRFWEGRFPQVKPLKRAGGRRYYRPEDVTLLGRIRDLLYTQGYTIKGVQKLLRDGDGEAGQPQTGRSLEKDVPVPSPETIPGLNGPAVPAKAAPAETKQPAVKPLSEPVRRELASILEELEQLRFLLRARDR